MSIVVLEQVRCFYLGERLPDDYSLEDVSIVFGWSPVSIRHHVTYSITHYITVLKLTSLARHIGY